MEREQQSGNPAFQYRNNWRGWAHGQTGPELCGNQASLSFEALRLAFELKSWPPYQLLSVTLKWPASDLMIPHAFFSLNGQGCYDMRFLSRMSCGWLANGCKGKQPQRVMYVWTPDLCSTTQAQQTTSVSELHLQAPLCTWPPLSHKRINRSRKKVSKKNSNKKIRLVKTFQKARVYQWVTVALQKWWG